MSVGLMALLAAAVALFVLSPLRRPAPPAAPEEGPDGLLRARAAADQALRDADFDHATGKISDADYADLRARYDARAPAVLRRLDARGRADAHAGRGTATGGGDPA